MVIARAAATRRAYQCLGWLQPLFGGSKFRIGPWHKDRTEAARDARRRAVADDAVIALDGETAAKVIAWGGADAIRERMQDQHLNAADVRTMLARLPDTASVATARQLQRRKQEHVEAYRETKAIALKAEPASAYDVSQLLPLWIASKGAGWRGRTRDAKRALGRFCAFLGERGDYRTVTRAQIVEWRSALADEGRSYTDQRDHLLKVSAMFSVAITRGERADNPCKASYPWAPKPTGGKPLATKRPRLRSCRLC